ncbi:glycosyltransferase [Sulfuricurvum sp.]|uniref:glycosyltransferase n=1 Tax=Sulfuricurvum sp. TaxID=2025608 RepID=UPI00260316EA|nr:glycosyltransferase [Sulfuricurvum sp.]MDD2781547.1 glycosyltransferase [Sulfuricurvum sp.]
MIDGLKLNGAEILVVSPTPTWPLDYGNRKRIFSVCNALKKRGAVIHFLHYPSEGEWRGHYPKQAERMMMEQWNYYYKAAPSRPLHTSPENDDHRIDEWWDNALEKEIKWLCSVNNFDAIIVNYTWLSKALDFVPTKCLKVLDTHDRFSNRGDLLETHGIKKEFFHTTQAEESKAFARADVVWAIKHEEEEFFRSLALQYGNLKTVFKTLLHVEDKPGFHFQCPNKANGYLTVGMVGARNNINVVNTKDFLKTALPIFEKYMTPVKIILAGTMCKDLQDFNHPFVEKIGRVEELDDFYTQLDIALVPMTFSTGLKIKVGEALAYGVPLIAHKHAYEGYPIFHDWQAMESLEEIAMAIVHAAYDPAIIEELRKATVDAQSALQSEVIDTIDHFCATLKGHRKTAVVVLPEYCYLQNSLYRLQAENVINNLNWEYRTVVYYPYKMTPGVQAYLEEKNDWLFVTCQETVTVPSQIWDRVTLEEIGKIWGFEILWNLSELTFNKEIFGHKYWYFDDRCLKQADLGNSYEGIDVLVQSIMQRTFSSNGALNWHVGPLPGIVSDLKNGLWQNKPVEECDTLYVMLSGTKKQIRFWYEFLMQLFAKQYNFMWLIDSNEIDWYIESRVNIQQVAKDYMELKKPARAALIINLEESDRIATAAWVLFVCGRKVFNIKEFIDGDGLMRLSSVNDRLANILESLDTQELTTRFEHHTSHMIEISELLNKLKHQTINLKF